MTKADLQKVANTCVEIAGEALGKGLFGYASDESVGRMATMLLEHYIQGGILLDELTEK